jgi:hypothetical protein
MLISFGFQLDDVEAVVVTEHHLEVGQDDLARQERVVVRDVGVREGDAVFQLCLQPLAKLFPGSGSTKWCAAVVE